MQRGFAWLLISLSLAVAPAARGSDPETAAKNSFGHSMQGEAFNDGPRQRAVRMKGIAPIDFPVTTRSPQARRFFLQGVAQLHAYWYFEAERSFRQAAAFDPDCAMAYWGMARANLNNRSRAKGFCEAAMARREKANPEERRWIEALAIWAGAAPDRPADDKNRDADYVAALRRLSRDFPAGIEAKAFLAQALLDRSSRPEETDEAEALLQAVLARNPMHPAHHYRIHLWDRPGNDRAADSADRSGPSQPASAHMWHMSGHTYTQLRRYRDAAWAQEASARVDHAHMRAARILPDQIFNYAHNNQWLAESLLFIGRARDAVAVAKNLVHNPRHPAYNPPDGYSSAGLGQNRLIEALTRYELWPETMALLADGCLEPTKNAEREWRRLSLVAVAAQQTGETKTAQRTRQTLALLAQAEPRVRPLCDTVDLYAAVAAGDRARAEPLFSRASLEKERAAGLRRRLGQTDAALALAREAVKEAPDRFLPLAALVLALHAAGKEDEALERFATLRSLGGSADQDTPVARELEDTARALGLPVDWRLPAPSQVAARFHPALETLGPALWSPFDAPPLAGVGIGSPPRNRPVLAVFFLGFACSGCLGQLEALARERAAWEQAGIDLVGVTLDPPARVARYLAEGDHAARFPFPIVSDPTLGAFKAYRAYDDFEGMPLHGLFLIDPAGKIRWQDIGFQPFSQTEFLLQEARRLLRQRP